MVVRQHTEGMVGSIVRILLEIDYSFQQWKKFENLFKVDKVIAMSWVYYFFWDTVYMLSQDVRPSVGLSVTRRYSVETAKHAVKPFFTVG